MKILAYQISGQTVGIDLDHWTSNDLNNNDPFKIIEDEESLPSGYTDVSSITSWGYWGEELDPRMNRIDIRKEIQKLLSPEAITGNTSGLTQSELETIQHYKLDNYYKIYNYYEEIPEDVSIEVAPHDMNYDILALHKNRSFNKGEIISVEYYGDHDYFTKTYSDLLVKEVREYHRLNHMIYRRNMAISWYLNDGTVGHVKNTVKYYTTQEGIRAGETRRANVITNVKITVVGLIMAASGITSVDAQELGRPFINTYSNEMAKYIQGYEDEIKNVITNDTQYDWLNLEIPNTGGITIRQYLISELTIDYEINNTNIEV